MLDASDHSLVDVFGPEEFDNRPAHGFQYVAADLRSGHLWFARVDVAFVELDGAGVITGRAIPPTAQPGIEATSERQFFVHPTAERSSTSTAQVGWPR